MAYDVGAGGIKDFSAFIDPSPFKYLLNYLVLIIVFVSIECWETTIRILVTLYPIKGSIYLFLIGYIRRWLYLLVLHFSI